MTGVDRAGAPNRLSAGGAQHGASARRPTLLCFASTSPQSGHTTMQSKIRPPDLTKFQGLCAETNS